jgi:hypothetical protein
VRLSAGLTATGGNGTFTWAIAAGSLPTGVMLDPATGAISGTPRAPGRFSFSISATDGESRATTIPLTLSVAPKLAVANRRLPAAKVGTAFTARLSPAGGVAPGKWVVRGRLPRGIRFDKKQALLVGTPRTAGRYKLTFEVTDALRVKAKRTLTLVVKV